LNVSAVSAAMVVVWARVERTADVVEEVMVSCEQSEC